MLKKIIFSYLLFLCFTVSFSQELEWAKSMGGALNDNGYSIDVDDKGNVYTTGDFKVISDFDPGPGIYNLTSRGESDVFISKIDNNGNFLWAKSFGGLSTNITNPIADVGHSIVTDKDGNVYVCGAFENTVDFDPGSGIYNLTSKGNADIFILKLDTDGNLLWVKNMGDLGPDVARAIAINNGYLYITGNFAGPVDFDPGPGVFDFGGSAYGSFILKLDINGNFIWAGNLSGGVVARSIAIDKFGNICTTGYFWGIADFDPGASIYNLGSANGRSDIFISKLDNNGNFMWAKRIINGGVFDRGELITSDIYGNIYTTGAFIGSVDFDPGPGIYNLTSKGNMDIFILKLDNNGNFIWAKSMGGHIPILEWV